MADEGNFIELLIANERVGQWLDTIKAKGTDRLQRIRAAKELTDAILSNECYAEEAKEGDAINILTKALGTTDDDEFLTAVSACIAACSGPHSTGPIVKSFEFEGITVRIRESALGDGLGAKLWGGAFLLCRELAQAPAYVADQDIAEIGAGVGLCGLLAAKLGAKQVVLTEGNFPQVCQNMRESAALSSTDEHAESSAGAGQSTGSDQDWDFGRVKIRYLDWSEEHEPPAEESPLPDPLLPPRIAPDAKYKVLIASDILYEPPHALQLATVIAQRLAPHGRCHWLLAVRQNWLYNKFRKHCQERGLRVCTTQVEDTEWNKVGIRGSCEYEGGFNQIHIEWADAPAPDWQCDHMWDPVQAKD